MHCTRCDGTGLLNVHQLNDEESARLDALGAESFVEQYGGPDCLPDDVAVCDCCGDGDGWYGAPGEHYNPQDPPGSYGPYDYNGGLCECN